MGKAADASAIHKRNFNSSKGSSSSNKVQSVEITIVKVLAQQVEATENLVLFQVLVDLEIKDQEIISSHKQGGTFNAKKVILTAGTLAGRLHIGQQQTDGGRSGDQNGDQLATLLSQHFEMGRLKTGTPRIARSSINFSELEVQSSEHDVRLMSDLGRQPLTNGLLYHVYKRQNTCNYWKYMHESPIFQQRMDLKALGIARQLNKK